MVKSKPKLVHHVRKLAKSARFSNLQLLLVGAVLAGIGTLLYFATRAAVVPAYVTIQFGRTIYTETQDGACTPYASGAKTIFDAATVLKNNGNKPGTGIVITDRTREDSARDCVNAVRSSNWSDLANLRDNFGWKMVSGGGHDTLTSLSPAAQQADVAGSLDTLAAHGHDKAWSLYAYADNRWNDELQASLVSQHYSYGRKYLYPNPGSDQPDAPLGKNVRSTTVAPFYQKTNDILGGKCNDSSLPCYSLTGVANNRRYRLPDQVLELVNGTGSNEWTDIQFFAFVEGTNTTGSGPKWDCTGDTSAARAKHYTTRPEMYCFNDYQYIIENIASSKNVVTPDVVADAWGRGMGPVVPPSTLKAPVKGLMKRDGDLPVVGSFAAAEKIDNLVIDVNWSALEPTAPTPDSDHPGEFIHHYTSAPGKGWNEIESKLSSRAVAVRLRIHAGADAPNWVKSIYPTGKGSVDAPAGEYTNAKGVSSPAVNCSNPSGANYKGPGIAFIEPVDVLPACIPYFWTDEVINNYKALISEVARRYDNNVGNAAKVRDVADSGCMTYYAEPFYRKFADPHNRTRVQDAGLTFALDKACHEKVLEHMNSTFTTMRVSLAINAWDNVDTGARDWAKMNAFATWARNGGNDSMGQPFAGMGQKLILQNNGLGESEGCPNWNNANVGGPEFCFLAGIGQPMGFQTETQGRLGYDTGANATEKCANFNIGLLHMLESAKRMGASFIELPGTTATCSLATSDQTKLQYYDGIFEANAIGGGGPSDSAPSTTITTPVSGAVLTGSRLVTATATDDHGVDHVDFYDGTNKIGTGTRISGTATNGIWQLTWNTVGVANGAHTLTAKAYDTASQEGVSAGVPVTITNGGGGDTQNPTISITSPTVPTGRANVNIFNTTTVTVSASDNVGVARVELSIGSVVLGNMTADTAHTGTYTYSFNTREVTSDRLLRHPNGAKVLKAVAYDAAGNHAQSTVPTFIDNGDVNGNGEVSVVDMSIMFNPNNWEHPGDRAHGDLDGNGVINVFDYSILLTYMEP